MPDCEHPELAEPGSAPERRRCGMCPSCKAAAGLVVIELLPEQAERLSLNQRYPPKIQEGDAAIADAIDEAVQAYYRLRGRA